MTTDSSVHPDSPVHHRFRARVPDKLPVRRIALFLAITFALNWIPAAYFFWEGVRFTDRNLPVFTYNVVIVLASFSPAVGHLLTRWLTDEGIDRERLLLPLRVRSHWREYVAVAVVPLVLAVVGAVVYFVAFPEHLAGRPIETFASTAGAISGLGTPAALLVVLLTTFVGLVPGAIMVFGEELGWRAYLLPKLTSLGPRTATLLTGVTWGVWHLPYVHLGLNYQGAQWLGTVAMLWVTTLYGVLLAWATFRTASVWPAAVGHAAFNTSARWGPMVADQTPNLALGPTTGGIVASLGWLVVAAWLLARSPVFERGGFDEPAVSAGRNQSAD